ncbi:unnamed protein product [Larinioides sclopetarius]|uniref:RRM domain-containing protein n=1 Tax=Larinioides sclopetarius TaxID=280406 RepID=A0AAV1Z226_9ARAC
MAYYYKINDGATAPPVEGIQVFDENSVDCSGPCIKYDFSKHVLIELLDNVTPETKLWTELGLANAKNITHKRMIVDPHRVNCRRAVVVCSSSDEAKELVQRLSQAKIMKRNICAVIIQELLSDICLFEKQIIQFGDKRSQHQLVYVTELPRRHKPSALAQYLREKFSPFGTILSVLVSEEKDGYAYPEGVIKFAHLSEAFAAELAYDQCAVALERLSVTTHHNILLSQCDLRARLREAYIRQSSEFSFNVSPESQFKKKPSKDSDSDQTKILPSSNSKSSMKESENNESFLNESRSSTIVVGNDEFPTDSAELVDVLKKPCESNLIDCLQGIAACSESSVSRRASVSSLPETEPGSTGPSTIPLSRNTSPLDKTWSSRIVGWITDLPNVDPSSQIDITANDSAVFETDVPILESTVLNGNNKNLECNQQVNASKSKSPLNVLSSASSYVTCTNGDSSFHSIPTSLGEVSDSNNVTMVDKTLSHDSECHLTELSYEETSNANGSSVWETTAIQSCSSPVSSLKRKNTSMVTQKLSLKSKRMNKSQSDHVSEVLGNETTVLLPSVSKTRTCSVVLNSFPELDEFAKNLSAEESHVVLLERLNVSPSVDRNSKTDRFDMPNIESKAKVKKYSKKEIDDGSSLIKSQPVRRSSRLTSRGSDKRSESFSNRSLENGTKAATPSNLVDRKKKSLEETESPLRMWLRKELDSSTNNLVTRSKESTKSIVCATTNKDVLISVGCSHMTCDFCYPDSTKLLLGFH